MDLKHEIEQCYNDIKSIKSIRDNNIRIIEGENNKLSVITKKISICKKSNLVLEYIINKKYTHVVDVFENTISSALKDIFDEEYEFRFEVTRHGDNCAVNFLIHTSDYIGFTPITWNHGNSIAEIIGVILRILVCKLDTSIKNIILLDEPLGGLEPEKQTIVARFIQNICKELSIQIIMISQSEYFSEYSDKVIEI